MGALKITLHTVGHFAVCGLALGCSLHWDAACTGMQLFSVVAQLDTARQVHVLCFTEAVT